MDRELNGARPGPGKGDPLWIPSAELTDNTRLSSFTRWLEHHAPVEP